MTTLRSVVPLLTAALLGLAAALLVSCGGSGSGLIPEASAGPLRADFEAVAKAAESGNGNCAATEQALGKTERDFLGLPASIAPSLRHQLEQGISNLHQRALAMCAEPTPTATTATTPTTPPRTETAPAQTTPTTPSSTATTPATPSNEGGGTRAPSEEEGEGKGKGKGAGKDAEGGGGETESGGASAGEAHPGGGR